MDNITGKLSDADTAVCIDCGQFFETGFGVRSEQRQEGDLICPDCGGSTLWVTRDGSWLVCLLMRGEINKDNTPLTP